MDCQKILKYSSYIGPFRVLSFAGIELDTMRMEARLPDDKLVNCRILISTFLRRKKLKLKELQSLIGLLNFVWSVVVPGCAFLRRLIDLRKCVQSAHHCIRFNKSAKDDLTIWQFFLDTFNVRSFFCMMGGAIRLPSICIRMLRKFRLWGHFL